MSAKDQMITFLTVQTDYNKRQLKHMKDVELKKLVNLYLAELNKDNHGKEETSI